MQLAHVSFAVGSQVPSPHVTESEQLVPSQIWPDGHEPQVPPQPSSPHWASPQEGLQQVPSMQVPLLHAQSSGQLSQVSPVSQVPLPHSAWVRHALSAHSSPFSQGPQFFALPQPSSITPQAAPTFAHSCGKQPPSPTVASGRAAPPSLELDLSSSKDETEHPPMSNTKSACRTKSRQVVMPKGSVAVVSAEVTLGRPADSGCVRC